MPTRDEKDKFSLMIEEEARKLNVSHIEMIVEYCERSGMEMEVAGSLLNSVLKGKIELEARELRYLPKQSVLPI